MFMHHFVTVTSIHLNVFSLCSLSLVVPERLISSRQSGPDTSLSQQPGHFIPAATFEHLRCQPRPQDGGEAAGGGGWERCWQLLQRREAQQPEIGGKACENWDEKRGVFWRRREKCSHGNIYNNVNNGSENGGQETRGEEGNKRGGGCFRDCTTGHAEKEE